LLYVDWLPIVGRVSKPGSPMREPSYFVLASLLDGPLHGYAIIKRTGELSAGRMRLATGTLYTALDRLTAEGYLTQVSQEVVNGRTRRSYALTPSGTAALQAEAQRMAAAAAVVIKPDASRRDARDQAGEPGRGLAHPDGTAARAPQSARGAGSRQRRQREATA